MNRFVVDGMPLELERLGSGRPVVLVHGLGGPAMWERVAPILSAQHDVLLPHLPGFGESPPAAAAPDAEGHAMLLAAMLGGLGIRGAVLAGMSYGGEIAAALAALDAGSPDGIVSRLVLVAPTGTRRLPAWLRSRSLRPVMRPLLGAALSSGAISELMSRRSFHDVATRPPDLVARHMAQMRRAGRIDAMVSALEELREGGGRLPGFVARTGAPVTLVQGENDRTVRPSSVEALLAVRPDMAVHVLPRCGHSAALERPRELAVIIAAAAAPGGVP
jgi:pimeloyl-ACP methyl ester carboxylesterase